MQPSQNQTVSNAHLGYLVAAELVVSLVVAGFFTGMQSPMYNYSRVFVANSPQSDGATDALVMPATDYSGMSFRNHGPNRDWNSSLSSLDPVEIEADQLLTITPEQRRFALAMRELNRAYNGAPPTVPHPIDQMSAVACAACHTEGASTETLRIPKMSHPFYANCTQCHVESTSTLTDLTPIANSFVGLPAPEGGPRAYEGAPPQIPHSVWMRNDCLSCHGPTGNYGIRTTHPWRTSCQQCHTPSSESNQIQLDAPQFLPPLEIESSFND